MVLLRTSHALSNGHGYGCQCQCYCKFPTQNFTDNQSNKTFDAYKTAAASASANVAPTFAPEGGVLSQAAPASSSGAAGSPGSTATASPSAATMNLHEAGFTTMFVVAMIALFGGFMAVF